MSLFPPTLPSAVRGLGSPDAKERARSLRTIAEAYWTPVYKYLRLRHRQAPELAEDTTQSFFARLLEGAVLAGHDPQRGRFRSFLRSALDHHVIDQHRRRTAARRGGPQPPVDLADVERELVAATDPEEAFDREWIARVVRLAIERTLEALARRDKPVHAELFRRFHVEDEPPSYDEVARELGITKTDVTNWLHVARREFKRVAIELIRELTASPEELADEALQVFGIKVDPGTRKAGRGPA